MPRAAEQPVKQDIKADFLEAISGLSALMLNELTDENILDGYIDAIALALKQYRNQLLREIQNRVAANEP